MHILGLESLIREHPVISVAAGVYVVYTLACLSYILLTRRKTKKLEEEIEKLRKKLLICDTIHHYSLLGRPHIRRLYREGSRLSGNN